MIDNVENVLDLLRGWHSQVRWAEGEGAHILVSEADHTQSCLVTYSVWEDLRAHHLSNDEENADLYQLAA